MAMMTDYAPTVSRSRGKGRRDAKKLQRAKTAAQFAHRMEKQSRADRERMQAASRVSKGLR